MKGVGSALHVVGRRLQGILRRRGAVQDVARLTEAVGGGGWVGAGARRAGPGQGGGGRVGSGRAAGMGVTCRSHGNVGVVSEKLQTFRSKEHARREFVGKE